MLLNPEQIQIWNLTKVFMIEKNLFDQKSSCISFKNPQQRACGLQEKPPDPERTLQTWNSSFFLSFFGGHFWPAWARIQVCWPIWIRIQSGSGSERLVWGFKLLSGQMSPMFTGLQQLEVTLRYRVGMGGIQRLPSSALSQNPHHLLPANAAKTIYLPSPLIEFNLDRNPTIN